MHQYTQADAASMDARGIADHWNDRARAFSDPHPRLRLIVRMVGELPQTPSTLLDLGCGPATLSTLIAPSIRYYGADVASEVVPLGQSPDRLAVADLSSSEDPFPGRTFDVVVASGIFEYMRDPAGFLALASRKTARDGHLVLSYLNRQHHRELRARLRGGSFAYPDPHLNFISLAETVRLLRRSGFSIVRTTLMTAGQRFHRVPLLAHRFPLNVVGRQLIFLCRAAALRG